MEESKTDALKKENAELRQEIERLKEKIRHYVAVLCMKAN